MESHDDAKKLWQENKEEIANPSPVSVERLAQIVRKQIRKEKKNIAGYFWATLSWQVLVYSFVCHLLIKHRDDTEMVMLSLGMLLVYLPYTYMLFKKIRAIYLPAHGAINSPTQDVHSNIREQFALLSSFFRFKKWFDWIVVPLSCFFFTAFMFNLYVSGGVSKNLTGGIITYLFALSLFIIATYIENKKRFIIPLRHLKAILNDIKNNC